MLSVYLRQTLLVASQFNVFIQFWQVAQKLKHYQKVYHVSVFSVEIRSKLLGLRGNIYRISLS
jgi:hypothetical protein